MFLPSVDLGGDVRHNARWFTRPTVIGVAAVGVVAAVVSIGLGVANAATPESSQTPSSEQSVIGEAGLGTDKVGPSDAESGGVALKEAPLTEEEAVWLSQQQPLGEVAYLAETSYPEQFAYAFFGTQGTDFKIGFKDDVPPEIIAALSKTGLSYSIDEHVGFTQSDYEDATASVIREFDVLAAPDVQFVVGPTPEISVGSITVTVHGGSEETIAEAKRIFDSLTAPRPFELTWGSPSNDQVTLSSYNRAGGTWLLNSSGTGVCTSGFVVKSTSNADLGLLTAGHCPNSLRFYHIPSGENYYLDFRNETYGSGGDIQFLRSSKMMDAWFHYNATSGRPVNTVRNAYVNENVCRYGRSSNELRCGWINGSNFTALITDSSGWSTYVSGQDSVSAATLAGDSGGPVFSVYTAMGTITAASGYNTFFTRISVGQSSTGTFVCKDPVCTP